VRSALRDLPQVAAPRSFTLTPAMAERETQPVTSRTTPSFVAMRVAGAGFAAVLAVVVMLDAGGIVDDDGSRSGDDSSTALFDAAPAGAPGVQEDAFAPMSDVSDGDADGLDPAGIIEVAPTGDDGSDPASGGTGGGVGGGPDSGGTASSGGGGPDSGGTAFGGDASGGDATADAGRAVPQPAEVVPETADEAATAITSEDDGLSSLLVIEIGLAAIAALAIGGSFVMRRRAESE
jgi:hypothetical protein